jgi:hypothetical protein
MHADGPAIHISSRVSRPPKGMGAPSNQYTRSGHSPSKPEARDLRSSIDFLTPGALQRTLVLHASGTTKPHPKVGPEEVSGIAV